MSIFQAKVSRQGCGFEGKSDPWTSAIEAEAQQLDKARSLQMPNACYCLWFGCVISLLQSDYDRF